MVAEIVFIISVALIAYVYVGYPALALALSRLRKRPVARRDILPRVSVIIAAHNEERDIEAKLRDTLALDYPADKLEIIVASDCSTDRTDDIVRRYAREGVMLSRHAERRGKTAAQRQAVGAASGEVLVFSDATSVYERTALRRLVRAFADPSVGCVAGQLIYVDAAASSVGRGCRSYWNYEKLLKGWESQFGSLIGVSGCLYAVRRDCFVGLAGGLIDDFAVATEMRLQGLRTVYEPEAVCFEETNRRGPDEFRMRVRVIARTLLALRHYRAALDPLRHGLFSWQLLSHKVLRYAVPLFLLAAFGAAWALDERSGFYGWAFYGQAAFYLLALLAWGGERLGIRLGPLAIPFFFVLVNAAPLVALLELVKGDRHVVWEPVREPQPEPGGPVALVGEEV
jgi:cellulose synthase/poly-beta-1,6-N-acetylglucosamine synthase-like glycosyltransferase